MTKGSKFKGLFEARSSQSTSPEKRGRGRPAGDAGGKRNNKDEFVQASAYLRIETHRLVKSALALEDKEFSELVEELLAGWLKLRS